MWGAGQQDADWRAVFQCRHTGAQQRHMGGNVGVGGWAWVRVGGWEGVTVGVTPPPPNLVPPWPY